MHPDAPPRDGPSALTSQEFWAGLVPGLTIGGPPAAPAFELSPGELLDVQSLVFDEGWFHLRPRLPRATIDRLADGIRTLRAAGLPPVCIFAYDEAWYLSQWVGGFLGVLLGDGFKLQPDFWAWYVDVGRAQRGWRPHRDKRRRSLLPNGAPASLTVWVALTEATPWNGCMYVYPAHHDPAYRDADLPDQILLPHEIRALPAEPGAVLGWTQALLHWGGRSSDLAAGPRVSLSIEYQRGDIEPLSSPPLEPGVLLPFWRRLTLIAHQLLRYGHMLDAEPFRELALMLQDAGADT